ncbi:LAQU0S05e03576g1_1 [Lachancea quebecensis]|uniref:LAQU0S05e03576g1_1 n=1 Tax=Lachancea quebecensis TaxID=1654605 RepID=A0A0P1KRR6_9SACH|nr:LAQU0S05e03576g1_1 [Lachancea quebecensis]
MKLSVIITAFLSATAYAAASNNVKSYILTLDDNQSALANKIQDLKSFVQEVGGKITHEYSLIKGFSLQLPADDTSDILQKIERFGEKLSCKLNLEQDQEVHTFKGPEAFEASAE